MPRIIAGMARGIQLAVPEGLDTRPTSDSRKEAVFSSIQFELPGCRFLDLFAGSGAAGLEALSRGAEHAVFVESGRQAVDCIHKNLTKTKLQAKGRVLAEDVLSALSRLAREQAQFDVIFLDPPYRRGYEELVCREVMEKGLLAEDGLIVVESAVETEFAVPQGMSITKSKSYRITKFTLLRRE